MAGEQSRRSGAGQGSGRDGKRAPSARSSPSNRARSAFVRPGAEGRVRARLAHGEVVHPDRRLRLIVSGFAIAGGKGPDQNPLAVAAVAAGGERLGPPAGRSR